MRQSFCGKDQLADVVSLLVVPAIASSPLDWSGVGEPDERCWLVDSLAEDCLFRKVSSARPENKTKKTRMLTCFDLANLLNLLRFPVRYGGYQSKLNGGRLCSNKNCLTKEPLAVVWRMKMRRVFGSFVVHWFLVCAQNPFNSSGVCLHTPRLASLPCYCPRCNQTKMYKLVVG